MQALHKLFQAPSVRTKPPVDQGKVLLQLLQYHQLVSLITAVVQGCLSIAICPKHRACWKLQSPLAMQSIPKAGGNSILIYHIHGALKLLAKGQSSQTKPEAFPESNKNGQTTFWMGSNVL